MPAWGQVNGGPLSEQEIDDTVAYVMALPRVNVVQPTEPPSSLVDIPWMRGWGRRAIVRGAVLGDRYRGNCIAAQERNLMLKAIPR